jgi:hypothetical protein
MTLEASENVIVELARDGEVDRNLRADPPPSVVGGRVILDHFATDADGRLEAPEGGEVVLSVLSPESLRDAERVENTILEADTGDEPPVIVVEAAEYLREDELAAVIDVAERLQRVIILRIMADA